MIDINDLLTRICAVQEELVSGSHAKPYMLYTSSEFPYWVNRVETIDTGGNSEDFDTHSVNVQMYLIAGQRTEGYEGEIEATLYGYVPTVVHGFNQREQLESAAYPTTLDDLRWARITQTRPMTILENSGAGGEQIAAIFTLTVDYDSAIDQETF